MAVKRELVGLNTYLYMFSLKDREKYHQYMSRLKKTGRVTEFFINNKLGFEYRRNRRVM